MKENVSISARQRSGRWQQMKKTFQREKWLHLMVLPGLILFFFFRYLPMNGVLIAFEDYDLLDGIFGSKWVGFENFIKFFKDPFFFRLLRNTAEIGLLTMLFGFPLPIILALSLNEVKGSGFKRSIQTVSYLPYFIPIVVLVGIMNEFFGFYGPVNELIEALGGSAQKFMSGKQWFRPMYIGSHLWQTMGYNSIVYMAALTAIDPTLYEAAIIDGAGRFQRIWHITLPGILPTVCTMLLLNLSKMLNIGFEKVFLMYSPASYSVADVFSTYVYRRGVQGLDFSYGAAIDLFNAILSLVLTFGVNKLVTAVGEDGLF